MMGFHDSQNPPKKIWLEWYGFSTGGGEWRVSLSPCKPFPYMTIGPYVIAPKRKRKTPA